MKLQLIQITITAVPATDIHAFFFFTKIFNPFHLVFTFYSIISSFNVVKIALFHFVRQYHAYRLES